MLQIVISWFKYILMAITSSSELIGICDDFMLVLTRIATPLLAQFGLVYLSLKKTIVVFYFCVMIWF